MRKDNIPFGSYCYNPLSDEDTICGFYKKNEDGTNECELINYVSKPDTDLEKDFFNEMCKVCNHNNELSELK